MTQDQKSDSKFAFFRQYARYYFSIGLGAIFVEGLGRVLAALLPFFTKLQVDQLQAHPTQWPWLSTLTQWKFFLVLLTVPLLLEVLRSWLTLWYEISLNTKARYQLELLSERLVWDKLKSFDAGYFENQRNRVILDAGFEGSRTIYDFYRFWRETISSLIGVITIVPLFGLVSWQLLLLVVVASWSQLLIQQFVRRMRQVDRLAISFIDNKVWRVHQAIKYSFHTLRTFQVIDQLIDQYQELAGHKNQLEVQSQQHLSTLDLIENIVGQVLTVLVQVYVGWHVFDGTFTIGTFTMVVAYTMQLNSLFGSIFSRWSDWQELDLNFSKLQYFLALKGRLRQTTQPKALPKSKSLQLKLRSVSFRYPDYSESERSFFEFMIQKLNVAVAKVQRSWLKSELQEWQLLLQEKSQSPEVLENVSLEFRSGQTKALLGRNGAGKTTLTRLILHHFEPESGEVLLNDIPVWQFEPDEYFGLFGWLQQQPFTLWQYTVRENLVLGVSRSVSDEELWSWLSRVGLDTAILSLPKGLDTILGEDATLSGGQQQLIALLRVLLQRRPIFIFDEGSSQLDIEKEATILELIKSQSNSAIVIFITHRITTARKADHIVVLDAGQVAEQGSHKELLKKPHGLYRKWWKMQVAE